MIEALEERQHGHGSQEQHEPTGPLLASGFVAAGVYGFERLRWSVFVMQIEFPRRVAQIPSHFDRAHVRGAPTAAARRLVLIDQQSRIPS